MGFFFVRSPKLWRVEKALCATYISLLFVVLFMNRVTLFDYSAYDAKIVGFCKDKDVAVLHAEELEGKVKPISIDLFANLRVGQQVFAIGSPVSIEFLTLLAKHFFFNAQLIESVLFIWYVK